MRGGVFSPLVGRHGELRGLMRAAKGAVAGRPGLVLLEGEAGIGKSRLGDELAGALHEQGWLVVRGNCSALGRRDLSLDPWRQVLRDLRRAWRGDEFRTLAGRLLGLVHPLLDNEYSGPRQAEPKAAVTAGAMYEALGEVLRRASAQGPLLVVVEDAHWADRSSWEFLDHFVRSLRSEPVLVLVTIRTHDGASESARVTAGELRRLHNVDSVELGRLDTGQVLEQVRHLTDGDPDHGLLDRAVRLSDGVPFIVEEIVDDAARGETGSSLAEHALGHRLDLLGPGATLLVEAASVADDPVSLRVLAAVCGRVGLGTGFDAAFVETRSFGVLEPDLAVETCSFRHALLSEAARGRVLPLARVRLHQEWAHALEDERASGRGVPAAALARHWLEADEPAPALTWSLVAADHAEHVGGVGEQLDLLLRAARLWPRVPHAEQLTGRRLGWLYADAAHAAYRMGDLSASEDAIRWARQAIPEHRDPALEAWLTIIETWIADLKGDHVPLEDVRAACGVMLTQPPSREPILAIHTLTHHLVAAGRADEADAYATRAFDIAEDLGDPSLIARSLARRGLITSSLGRHDTARDLLRRARSTAADPAVDVETRHSIEIALGVVLDTAGRIVEATDAAARGVAMTGGERPGPYPVDWANAVLNHVAGLLDLGRWDEAETWISRVDQSPDMPVWITGWAKESTALLTLWRHGTPEDTEPLLRATDIAPLLDHLSDAPLDELVSATFARVEVLSGMGDSEGARAIARRVLAQHRVVQAGSMLFRLMDLAAREHLASLALRPSTSQDDSDTARIEELLALVQAASARDRALAAETHAYLSEIHGTADLSTWQDVVNRWREVSMPHALGWALLRLAAAAVDSGDRRLARQATHQAVDIADALGAGPLKGAAEELMRTAHLPGGGRPDSTPLGLTPRELEVLQMLAEGASNRGIAEGLFISPKTVSVHVTHILEKLAVTSRGEAAALARRQGIGRAGL